jgi:dihydrofolate reductase/thymidylate synthase
MLEIIVAQDTKGIIGHGQMLPWHFKEDLKYFREKTMKDGRNVMIMGRKTFESLPPLHGRDVIVVSSKKLVTSNQITVFDNVESLLSSLQTKKYRHCFLIGGASLIRSVIEKSPMSIDKIHLTFIHGEFPGDVSMPPLAYDDFYLTTIDRQRCLNHDDQTHYDLDFITLTRRPNQKGERQYIEMVQNVLQYGDVSVDRTGVGVRTLFGEKMEFDLDYGLPVLTSKKVFFRGIVEELLWFLSGSTDANVLKAKNIHIWDDNTNRAFLDQHGLSHYDEGDGGPIYGFQLRHFGEEYKDCHTTYQGFDQIKYVLYLLKHEPWSRRMVINLWDPSKLKEMVLPPCHMTYHFKVEKERLSCILYQRSGDLGLGVPFNIVSASIFVYIMAFLSNRKPGRLIHFLGDVHIYHSHEEALRKQCQNSLFYFPKLEIVDRGQQNVEEFEVTDFVLRGYRGSHKINMPMAV